MVHLSCLHLLMDEGEGAAKWDFLEFQNMQLQEVLIGSTLVISSHEKVDAGTSAPPITFCHGTEVWVCALGVLGADVWLDNGSATCAKTCMCAGVDVHVYKQGTDTNEGEK